MTGGGQDMEDCPNWSQSILGPDLEAAGPDNTEELRDNGDQPSSAFEHTHEINDSVLLHHLSRQSSGDYAVLPTAIVCP